MLFLLLSIVSSVVIAIILRINESRGGDRVVVAGSNYVVAALLGIGLSWNALASVPIAGALFAVAVGGGFVAGFLALMRAMSTMGLAVPATTARISTIVPIAGSILFYREVPSPFQMIGMAAGVAAFVLLGIAHRDLHNRGGAGGAAILAAVFLVAGFVDFSMKVAHESGIAPEPFVTIVFAAATGFCWLGVAVRQRPIRRGEVLLGAILGVPNFCAAYFILLAMRSLPGVVVFPAVNAGIVVLVTACAVIFWRERPNRIAMAGLALAAAAVVLLGLEG